MTKNQKELISKAQKLLLEAQKESSALDNLYGELDYWITEIDAKLADFQIKL